MCLVISAKPLNVAVGALVVGIVLFINEIGSKISKYKTVNSFLKKCNIYVKTTSIVYINVCILLTLTVFYLFNTALVYLS